MDSVSTNANELLNTVVGASIGIFLLMIGIAIAFYIVYVVALAKLFNKANEAGWKAIIPFYNTFILIKIAGLNWWYFLIAISGTIVSILGINGLNGICTIALFVVNFFIFYNLAKKMHQNHVTYGVLGMLFSTIIVMILGFSRNYSYDSSVNVSPNGPIGDSTSSNKQPERFCLGCGCKLKPNSKFCENCGKEV